MPKPAYIEFHVVEITNNHHPLQEPECVRSRHTTHSNAERDIWRLCALATLESKPRQFYIRKVYNNQPTEPYHG